MDLVYGGSFVIGPPHKSTEGIYDTDGIYFLHDPTIASQNCEEVSEPGVGRSVTISSRGSRPRRASW